MSETTTTSESLDFQPFRAFTFDSFGIVKEIVTQGSSEQRKLQAVKTWGEPADPNKCVLTASINDDKSLLAVARKDGLIEVLGYVYGDAGYSLPNDNQIQAGDNPIVGLHIFKNQREELPSERSCTLFTCTRKGHMSMGSVEFPCSPTFNYAPASYDLSASGNIFCSKVHQTETHALFGGEEFEVKVWDFEKCAEQWSAEPPTENTSGLFTPTWFTCATFLSSVDFRKFVAGTNKHQLFMYNVAEKRPVLPLPSFKKSPINAVAEDQDGNIIYVGNGVGDLTALDIRTGKHELFNGKCSGSIRSIVRHPSLPIVASCGTDRYLRIWDINSRQFLSEVYLDQPLTNVVFDSQYKEVEGEEEPFTRKRKKSKEAPKGLDEAEEEEEENPLEQENASKDVDGSKKSKKKKKKKKKKMTEKASRDVDEPLHEQTETGTVEEEIGTHKPKKSTEGLTKDGTEKKKSMKKVSKDLDEEEGVEKPFQQKNTSKDVDGSMKSKSKRKKKEKRGES